MIVLKIVSVLVLLEAGFFLVALALAVWSEHRRG